MTDKELRKLSRLELLELLLEASKENKELKDKIERLKLENKTAHNIENLSVTTRQVENALKYANGLTSALKNIPKEPVRSNYYDRFNAAEKRETTGAKKSSVSDKEIYKRILSFFAKNDDKLDVFPDELEYDVRERIKSILEKRNSK